MKVALYYAPNTCALAPYVTLTEARADFEVRPLNFRKRQNFSPEYLKINPKHKVPSLVVDGKILTENVAIHQWVHRTFPEAKILPADPWDQLQAISLHAWCASGIHPYLSRINNPPKVCDATGASDSVVKLATEFLFEAFKIGDDLLSGREYFFDHFTAPDAHFFWCCRRATQLEVDISGFPNVVAHFKRMQERPSVKKLLAYKRSERRVCQNSLGELRRYTQLPRSRSILLCLAGTRSGTSERSEIELLISISRRTANFFDLLSTLSTNWDKSSHEIDAIREKFREKMYVFIAPLDKTNARIADMIGISFVRLARVMRPDKVYHRYMDRASRDDRVLARPRRGITGPD